MYSVNKVCQDKEKINNGRANNATGGWVGTKKSPTDLSIGGADSQ